MEKEVNTIHTLYQWGYVIEFEYLTILFLFREQNVVLEGF